jgi:formylglycine-generating enzyme required for sulfatase activity
LGEFGLDRLSLAERRNHLPRLLQLYQDDPDSGIHGAAEWLLRQWQAEDKLEEIDKKLATGKVEGKRQWYINRQRYTMIVIPNAGEFQMGEGIERHRHQIGRSFAIASKEVTVKQFLTYRKDQGYSGPKDQGYYKQYAPSSDCPINMVSWYDAAAYCNWLSEQEGIPKEQWCYEPNKEGKYEQGMKIVPNYLQRTGYRLPTEAEWEYACRASAETAYSFGEPDDLLGKYAWYRGNSETCQPVGKLRPNDWGLFDMHGNAIEWSQDVSKDIERWFDKKLVASDNEDTEDVNNHNRRVLRGGSITDKAWLVHSAIRYKYDPAIHGFYIGFRPARTLPP